MNRTNCGRAGILQAGENKHPLSLLPIVVSTLTSGEKSEVVGCRAWGCLLIKEKL